MLCYHFKDTVKERIDLVEFVGKFEKNLFLIFPFWFVTGLKGPQHTSFKKLFNEELVPVRQCGETS